MEPQIPRKTADVTTLPNGDVVWVKTLSDLLRDQADAESNWHTQSVCRRYMKGGDRCAELTERMSDLSPHEQALYLAGQEMWMFRLQHKASEKYFDPLRPEKNELSDEAYMTACLAWEADCQKMAEKRKKFEETLFKAEQDKALALTPKTRVERCCGAYAEREFAKEYFARNTLETLLRAVRRDNDHTRPYFTNVQDIADDDARREHLTAFYRSLDSVTPAEVPTSPAA